MVSNQENMFRCFLLARGQLLMRRQISGGRGKGGRKGGGKCSVNSTPPGYEPELGGTKAQTDSLGNNGLTGLTYVSYF